MTRLLLRLTVRVMGVLVWVATRLVEREARATQRRYFGYNARCLSCLMWVAEVDLEQRCLLCAADEVAWRAASRGRAS